MNPRPSDLPDATPGRRARLEEALEAWQAAVAAGGEGLPEALAALDRYVAAEGASLPGQLRHFLEQRSYGKARQWLAAAPR